VITDPGRQDVAAPLAGTAVGNMHIKTRQINFIKSLLLLLLLITTLVATGSCSA